MGDHRFSFKAEFKMHGVEEKFELGWHNWSGGRAGIDRRITDWLESAVSKAYEKYDDACQQAYAQQNKAQIERDERATLDRLKVKYEQS